MRKKSLPALLLAFVLLLSLAPSALAEEPELYTVEVEGSFDQTGAREMLAMVNKLRTGEDAWQLNENGERVYLTDLGELQYSYALEEIAMQRAIEVALSFDHARPNGEMYYSCIASDGTETYGENIAAGRGMMTTAAEAFESWCETDEPYEGQGHRRNMLEGGFHSIGIAHVVYEGTHYWVQEFSWLAELGTPCAAPDGKRLCTVDISKDWVTGYGTAMPEQTELSLTVGESIAAPQAGSELTIYEAWYSKPPMAWILPDWQSGDESIAKVENGRVTALAPGETSLTASAFGGQELCVAVKVSGGGNAGIDLNGDGKLNSGDLLLLRLYLLGKDTDLDGALADLNGDGAVNILDLVRLRKTLAFMD